ncbi:MAG: antibiotic biosynthesis monooxygenase [Deltaproteobacteria bacterium]|nr:antibiotic biosynthesis monooxygenase [Deltaproteobacteria bacterium]
MAVTVIIKRTFDDDAKAKALAPLIVKLRSLATIQPGYISGKTLHCLDCQGEYLVVSSWNTLEAWQQWFNSEQRKSFQEKIDTLLGEKTQYRVYEPLVGGIIPKFPASES